MDISTLRILLAVARMGSFAAVARAQGIDPSSVSRLVAQAEASLGLRLFQRNTRRLVLTDAGEIYLARIAPLVEELDAARDAAAAGQADMRGRLRLTASVAFAHVCLLPHLGAFRAAYPGLEVELLSTDDNIDVFQQGVDLAFRLTDAPSGDLVSTRLTGTRYHVCAAPDYIARHGAVGAPGDLSGRDCLRFALPEYRSRWVFRSDRGEIAEIAIAGTLTLSCALSLRQAARNGMGPALLADWLVRGDLASGRLVDLFPGHRAMATSFDTGLWALYPSRRYLPRKVRAAIDFFRPRLVSPAEDIAQ